jgi:hypothetical protein
MSNVDPLMAKLLVGFWLVKFDLMDENLNLSLERAIIKNKIIIDIIYITNFKRTRDYMEPDMMNLALN